ncbi:MAG: D-alanyl-D-alanine dipeptidase [Flavobacteriaceae bacterium]
MKFILIPFLTFFTLISCKKKRAVIIPPISKVVITDSVKEKLDSALERGRLKLDLKQINDTTFVNINRIDSTFLFNLKYASIDNFLKEKVYDCDACVLRYATIKKLLKANSEFKKLGYRIQFFDCYRPLSIQEKMWEIYPDKRYVADPKKGSNHNRGTAVDITLVDSLGVALDMGTAFDFFGNKAHHAYPHLPQKVLENRRLLKTVMESHGFWSITSEWWHYNLNASYKYSVSDFKTECDDLIDSHKISDQIR